MSQQYPHYKIAQYSIIIDVLGGVSRKTLDSIKELGVRADKILLDMQKAIISSTLNIARSFKSFSLRRTYETGQNFCHNFLGFLILFENLYLLRIILGYGIGQATRLRLVNILFKEPSLSFTAIIIIITTTTFSFTFGKLVIR